MSAGAFELGFYQADSADIHLIRLQPETASTLTLAGNAVTPPSGPATSPFWAKVTRGSNEYGLRPRAVSIKWTGTPPTGYKADETLDVIVQSTADFNGVTVGAAAEYLGTACQVVGKRPENIYPGI